MNKDLEIKKLSEIVYEKDEINKKIQAKHKYIMRENFNIEDIKEITELYGSYLHYKKESDNQLKIVKNG